LRSAGVKACVVLVFFAFIGSMLPIASPVSASIGNISEQEDAVLHLVNGSSIYQIDRQLEAIGLKYPAFRSAGSAGANETAAFIFDKFNELGLQTWNETFDFQTWDLRRPPTLYVDMDANASTVEDREQLRSFQADHLSWPSMQNGSEGAIVVLPLPKTSSYDEIGFKSLDASSWSGINTTGKIVVIGREVRWNDEWERAYVAKLRAQPPIGVVLTYWNDWLEPLSVYSMGSSGARPLSAYGDYYWQLKIPVGTLNYSDGRSIITKAQASSISAKMQIDAMIGQGEHKNVLARIEGSNEPEKMVLLTAHYDSVMTPGFCDNGAGTAGLLHLAQVLAQAHADGIYRPRFSILFVAFAAEELGTIGSMQFVHRHLSEMSDIQAVINLDCIGSKELFISETNPGSSFDLDEVAKQAAVDLGIMLQVGPGGSDQDSFRTPVGAGQAYQQYWGVDPGISNAVPVESSILVMSEPLLIQDFWVRGEPGWIHTSRDASVPDGIQNWIDADRLGDGAKLAVMTAMRTAPEAAEAPDQGAALPLIAGLIAVTLISAAVIILYRKRGRGS